MSKATETRSLTLFLITLNTSLYIGANFQVSSIVDKIFEIKLKIQKKFNIMKKALQLIIIGSLLLLVGNLKLHFNKIDF